MTNLDIDSTDIASGDLADLDDLSRARHARGKALPNYHEDSGEYISDSEVPERASLPERPYSHAIVSVVHASDDLQDDPHTTEPIPRLQAQREIELEASRTTEGKEPIEQAGKKDIKEYLSSTKFKCVSSHDPEKLSEFAYAPTEKGLILSVEKPLSNTNFKRMKALLRRRVKPSRYAHCVAVAQTAEKMAEAYGVDPRVARMAGLLHDWDKALSPKRLRDRVARYHLDVDGPTQINMPHLLHGPTAAAVLADEFPEFGTEVFQAIARHTVGGRDMTPLDMIVFCADKLEPGNDVQVYRDLYDQIGKISLLDLFRRVQGEGMIYLLNSGRPLNIDAVEVWNYYCAAKERDGE